MGVLRAYHGTAASRREHPAYRDAARRLVVAIDRHRRVGAEEGIDPEPRDRALGKAVNEVRVPHGASKVAVADLLALARGNNGHQPAAFADLSLQEACRA